MLLLSHLAGENLIREPAQRHTTGEQRIQTQVVRMQKPMKVKSAMFHSMHEHICVYWQAGMSSLLNLCPLPVAHILSFSLPLLNLGSRICVRQSAGYYIMI